jgi:glycosyltransferase involved in cell wall biosynthesis
MGIGKRAGMHAGNNKPDNVGYVGNEIRTNRPGNFGEFLKFILIYIRGCPGPDKFRLIIAGGGEEEASLKTLTISLNLKNVEFTGWYDHRKLEEIMRVVDLSVVMRSPNMANNFVVTTCLLENWAFKKPVLAPNLEAFKNVIDGTNGVLFNVGEPSDLAEKIYTLSQSKSKINQLKKNGYETAQRLFDHRYIAKKMANTLLKYI